MLNIAPLTQFSHFLVPNLGNVYPIQAFLIHHLAQFTHLIINYSFLIYPRLLNMNPSGMLNLAHSAQF